ncbi:MAG: hypothetical protein IK140_03680 [Clostridia bacterium]|nr:hypothetical protein [Clostridia bacterium]
MNPSQPDTAARPDPGGNKAGTAAPGGKDRPGMLSAAVTGVCALALVLLFLWHYLTRGIVFAWYEYAWAALYLTLFIVVGARFVPVWLKAWSGKSVSLPRREKAGFREYGLVALAVLAAHAAVWLFAFIHTRLTGDTFSGPFSYLYASDSPHYLDIAENWYVNDGPRGQVVRLVFLPLYPLIVRAVSFLTGDTYSAAIGVSVICSCGAGCMLYRTALDSMGRKAARRAVKYFCLFPGFFFYGCALSESLFLLLGLCCVFFSARRRWLPAAVYAGFAAFTRSPGVLFAAPLLFELIGAAAQADRAERRRLTRTGVLCTLITLSGFAAYLYVNYRVSGSWFRFLDYQKENWFQSPGWFFDTPRYQLDYFVRYIRDKSVPNAFGLWGANLLSLLSALLLMAFTARTQRPSHTAYFLVYFVFTTGVTWLLSGPRYMLACFPLVLALALLSRRRAADAALTALCIIFSALLFLAYLSNGVPVY